MSSNMAISLNTLLIKLGWKIQNYRKSYTYTHKKYEEIQISKELSYQFDLERAIEDISENYDVNPNVIKYILDNLYFFKRKLDILNLFNGEHSYYFIANYSHLTDIDAFITFRQDETGWNVELIAVLNIFNSRLVHIEKKIRIDDILTGGKHYYDRSSLYDILKKQFEEIILKKIEQEMIADNSNYKTDYHRLISDRIDLILNNRDLSSFAIFKKEELNLVLQVSKNNQLKDALTIMEKIITFKDIDFSNI